jgi:crossover junction endodeoxyribonuclease RusA
MTTLILPWPARVLHPNARTHWAPKAEATKAARATAHLLAKEAGWHRLTLPQGRLHLWVDGYPPNRNRRDTACFLSSLKAAIDGIADALGIDDSRFVPHPFLMDETRPNGEVHVRITGGPA